MTQEAFVICALSIVSLKDGAKFRPWLLKTLSRAAWKYCRKTKRETPVAEFFETGEAESCLLYTSCSWRPRMGSARKRLTRPE